MIVLGIETSTAVCSVGVYEEEREAERSLVESRIHSEKLLTLVQEVLEETDTALEAIGAVAVSIGPGSFTGLRIGLSTAKGLCFALGKPLVAVRTFEVIALAVHERHPRVARIVVAVDAKRGEYYVGEFRGAPELEEVGTIRVLPADEAFAGVRGSLVVTDDVELVRGRFGEGVQVEPLGPFCRGAVVARIGYRKVLRKEFADVASIEPMYLKDFVVRTLPRV